MSKIRISIASGEGNYSFSLDIYAFVAALCLLAVGLFAAFFYGVHSIAPGVLTSSLIQSEGKVVEVVPRSSLPEFPKKINAELRYSTPSLADDTAIAIERLGTEQTQAGLKIHFEIANYISTPAQGYIGAVGIYETDTESFAVTSHPGLDPNNLLLSLRKEKGISYSAKNRVGKTLLLPKPAKSGSFSKVLIQISNGESSVTRTLNL